MKPYTEYPKGYKTPEQVRRTQLLDEIVARDQAMGLYESPTHEKEHDHVTRLEVIRFHGDFPREYVRYLEEDEYLDFHYQDGGETLKIFIQKLKEIPHDKKTTD